MLLGGGGGGGVLVPGWKGGGLGEAYNAEERWLSVCGAKAEEPERQRANRAAWNFIALMIKFTF